MDIRSYLAEGEELERKSSPAPWEVDGKHLDYGGPALLANKHHTLAECDLGDAAFIADARERLPRYRKALEEVLQMKPVDAYHETGGPAHWCLEQKDVIAAIHKALSE